jgi:hypothetical protein
MKRRLLPSQLRRCNQRSWSAVGLIVRQTERGKNVDFELVGQAMAIFERYDAGGFDLRGLGRE